MRLKVSSAKRRPLCLGLNVLTSIPGACPTKYRIDQIRSNSNFAWNSYRCAFDDSRPIITKFGTRHDSRTVVTCTKFRYDRPTIIEIRGTRIFSKFWIRSNLSIRYLVGQAPAWICNRKPCKVCNEIIHPSPNFLKWTSNLILNYIIDIITCPGDSQSQSILVEGAPALYYPNLLWIYAGLLPDNWLEICRKHLQYLLFHGVLHIGKVSAISKQKCRTISNYNYLYIVVNLLSCRCV